MLAQLTCVVANANRGKNSRAFKLTDFLPGYEQPDQDFDTIVTKLKEASRGNQRR